MDDHTGPIAPDPFDEDGVGLLVCDSVCVPQGEYVVRYQRYWTAVYWNTPKVFVEFSIVSPDEYAGLPVERMYNVAQLLGPPRPRGNFRPLPRGDLLRELRGLIGDPGRPDRLSFTRLWSKNILAKIVTVEKDRRGKALGPLDQYSKIGELIRVVDLDSQQTH